MNREAFSLFGMQIYWYGIIIAGAIIVAFVLASFMMKKVGFRDEIVFEVLLFLISLGLVGAGLMYLTFTKGASLLDFFSFRDGGIAIWGGIIFGALGVFLYTRFIRKSSFFAISDIVTVVLILAQSIGRWGNFFNQEVYGLSTGSFHFFPLTVMIGNNPHLALFFYESVLNLIGFIILFRIFSKQKKWGTTTAVYLIIYGTIRASLELLRDTTYIMNSVGFPVSMVISVLSIGVGILLLYLNKLGKLSQKDIALRPTKEESKKRAARNKSK